MALIGFTKESLGNCCLPKVGNVCAMFLFSGDFFIVSYHKTDKVLGFLESFCNLHEG